MKLAIDFPEIDLKFMRETYKGTGFSFVLSAIKNECVNAVYNGTPYEERKTGKWIDHSEDGYVECPLCSHLTTCEGNIEDLHYCFWCGAKMEVEE